MQCCCQIVLTHRSAPLLLAALGTTPLFFVMSRSTASRFTFSFAAASLCKEVIVSAAAKI